MKERFSKKLTVLLLFTAFTTGVCTLSSAQKYTPNPVLDKFVGYWVSDGGGRRVEIVLKKVTDTGRTSAGSFVIDVLEGYYIYHIQGELIENTQNRKRPALRNGSSFGFEYTLAKDEAEFILSDSIKRKGGVLVLGFKQGKPDYLIGGPRNIEDAGARIQGDPPFDPTFTLPNSMVFIRKEDLPMPVERDLINHK